MASVKKRYSVAIDEAFDSTINVLGTLDIHIGKINRDEGSIEASTYLSSKSWGEEIQIKITPIRKEVEIEIVSFPQMQLIDWGKSTENIEAIFKNLDRFLSDRGFI